MHWLPILDVLLRAALCTFSDCTTNSIFGLVPIKLPNLSAKNLFGSSDCSTREIFDLVPVNFYNLSIECHVSLSPGFYRHHNNLSAIVSVEPTHTAATLNTVIVSIIETRVHLLPVTRAPQLPSSTLPAESNFPTIADPFAPIGTFTIATTFDPQGVTQYQKYSRNLITSHPTQTISTARSGLHPSLPANTASACSCVPLPRNFLRAVIDAAKARGISPPSPVTLLLFNVTRPLFHNFIIQAPSVWYRISRGFARLMIDRRCSLGRNCPTWFQGGTWRFQAALARRYEVSVASILTYHPAHYISIPVSTFRWIHQYRIEFDPNNPFRDIKMIWTILQDPTADEYQGLELFYPSLVWLNATRGAIVSTKEYTFNTYYTARDNVHQGIASVVKSSLSRATLGVEALWRKRHRIYLRVAVFFLEYIVVRGIFQMYMLYGFTLWLFRGVSANYDTSRNEGYYPDQNGYMRWRSGTRNISRDHSWSQFYLILSVMVGYCIVVPMILGPWWAFCIMVKYGCRLATCLKNDILSIWNELPPLTEKSRRAAEMERVLEREKRLRQAYEARLQEQAERNRQRVIQMQIAGFDDFTIKQRFKDYRIERLTQLKEDFRIGLSVQKCGRHPEEKPAPPPPPPPPAAPRFPRLSPRPMPLSLVIEKLSEYRPAPAPEPEPPTEPEVVDPPDEPTPTTFMPMLGKVYA